MIRAHLVTDSLTARTTLSVEVILSEAFRAMPRDVQRREIEASMTTANEMLQRQVDRPVSAASVA